jgi:large subunit ribosomal protein L5
MAKKEKAEKGEKPEKGDKPAKADKAEKGEAVQAVAPRLQEKYEKEIRPALQQELGDRNIHAVPKLVKIIINMGVGVAIQDKKHLDPCVEALTQIAGQKPVITKSRKAISGFKLRENLPIGCKVTLRRQRMYEFFDRLISLALPRVRDFRGISRTAFDGHGNYTLGLQEQLVFPELNPDKYTRIQGMNISFVTTAETDDEARDLLARFGMPFQAEGGDDKRGAA